MNSSTALEGLTVIDLSRILAGPWATQTLADLGADVIKVEAVEKGDDTRHWGPPWVKDTHGSDTNESAYFQCANRGKKSITIDLNSQDDLYTLLELISGADILVENFKVGGIKRFGLDYETLAQSNPGLIYCSITGFGQTGPYASKPGYDFIIQAMGGLMSITGEPDGQPGAGPQKIGVALSDIMTGLYATIGILAAVNERQVSGMGQQVDLSLLDVTAATLANQATNYLVGGIVPGRLGNAHPNIVPYQAFKTSDSYMIVAIGNDEQFLRYAKLINEEWLIKDERFSTNKMRVKYRKELIPILESAMLKNTTDTWLRLMSMQGIAAGPINSIEDVFNDPQILSRGMCVELEQEGGATVKVAGNPIKLSRTPVKYTNAPPLLGEHNDELKR